VTTSIRRATPEISPAERRELLHAARLALIAHLDGDEPPVFERASSALRKARPTFVTLRHRETGELRGCRGEIRARQPLIDSVIEMVVASAVGDPRFEPVRRGEVDELTISISVLSEMWPIRAEEIEVGRHGLMIVRDRRAGLLLPSVPIASGWDREQFLAALCLKAGLPESAWRHSGSELLAFEAVSWGEDEIV
jgi:AmmeMemoRadiSam system protein A